jgi:hypothetical protein
MTTVQPLDDLTQLPDGAVHTYTCGSFRAAEHLGQLAVRQIVPTTQHKSFARVRRQLLQRALQQFDPVILRIICCRREHQISVTLATRVVVHADVACDSVKPGGKARLAFEIPCMAHDPEKRLLYQVVCVHAIKRESRTQCKHTRVMAPEQLIQRVRIANGNACHQGFIRIKTHNCDLE